MGEASRDACTAGLQKLMSFAGQPKAVLLCQSKWILLFR